ncbi:MAG: hypothetical protein ACE5HG_00240 [Candidatus Bathyarchaeia archaeon]
MADKPQSTTKKQERYAEREPGELERRLTAVIDSLSDRRLRWLIGRGKPITEREEITSQEFEKLLEDILEVEIERKMIVDKLKHGPLVLSELSKLVPLPPKQIFKHLISLRRWNIVLIAGERNGELEFKLA